MSNEVDVRNCSIIGCHSAHILQRMVDGQRVTEARIFEAAAFDVLSGAVHPEGVEIELKKGDVLLIGKHLVRALFQLCDNPKTRALFEL